MDKRIIFLNKLKSRLHDYLDSGSQKDWQETDSNSRKELSLNLSSLRAQMLLENVKSGLAIEDDSFDNSGIYAEYSVDGVLSFHIYPKMFTLSSLDEPIERLDSEKNSFEQSPALILRKK